MIIEYFLFCLSFPLFVSVFAANKKGLRQQSLEVIGFVIFFFAWFVPGIFCERKTTNIGRLLFVLVDVISKSNNRQ